MTAYVIIVDFRLKPGTRENFRRLIDANARESLHHEHGCRRFDVLEPMAESDRVLLYEIYADRAAFDLHVRSQHFARFEAESSAMVAAKSVVECKLVLDGSQ